MFGTLDERHEPPRLAGNRLRRIAASLAAHAEREGRGVVDEFEGAGCMRAFGDGEPYASVFRKREFGIGEPAPRSTLPP